jgi:hypothetical protein
MRNAYYQAIRLYLSTTNTFWINTFLINSSHTVLKWEESVMHKQFPRYNETLPLPIKGQTFFTHQSIHSYSYSVHWIMRLCYWSLVYCFQWKEAWTHWLLWLGKLVSRSTCACNRTTTIWFDNKTSNQNALLVFYAL